MSLASLLDGYLTGGLVGVPIWHKNQGLSLLFLLDGYLTGCGRAWSEEGCCAA